MILKSTISSDTCMISNKLENREDVLQAIAEIGSKNKSLSHYSKKEIFTALLQREEVGSTGFGRGIAIPHCGLDTARDFVVGIVVSKKEIDFGSADKKKSNLFFYIIGPSAQRNRHIQILSAISRLMQSDSIIQSLIGATTTAEMLDIIERNSESAGSFRDETPKVLFHVFIQKEHYFNDILQVFSELVDGSIAVTETFNAGHYLYSLPIFSTFWNDDSSKYSRVIQAVCDKKLANNIIRRINTIVPDIDNRAGVLITTTDLFYTNGSIDF